MSTLDHNESEGCDDAAAKDHLKRAEAELQHAVTDLEKAEAEVGKAEADVHKAEQEVEEAERPDREIEVTVDNKPKFVKRGTYLVSTFKQLVGVAADRELDVVRDGVFTPLDDNKEITIHECEVFVSHARTGGSS
jgi:DNA repair exonuclease SbcCD ATPase subunit